ncbi:ribulose-phosphate 3-epimerase [Deinobacterium chartae]|uniref:Ribulose-phosphate 3-epimerase n=1 Tax=Deinobacterium chartae TaxID=521158 RepID=A0A841HZD9_9DEIO|nr:ribulose-phosphate 3-epimerase [Deinobacterium chartae]
MTKLAPSILSADFTRLGDQLRAAEEGGADWIHVDVMDGAFVPNITLGPLVVEACRRTTSLPLDVHLMIERPERYLEDFVRAGASILTVHAEATVHLHRAVTRVRELGARAGVVLNPGTSLEALRPVLEDANVVLIMSVNPGFGGQRFIPQSLERVRTVRRWLDELGSGAELEVDGGVNAGNARSLVEAGATVLVAGSAVYNAHPVADNLAALRRAAQGGTL